MLATRHAGGSPVAVTVLGFLLLLGAVIAMTTFAAAEAVSFLLVPLLVGVTLPILRKQAEREDDPSLYRLLVVALLVKLLFGLIRFYMTWYVYTDQDASGYYRAGLDIAANFRRGIFDTNLPSLTSTDFLRFLSGVVYTVLPSASKIGAFLIFTWIAFLGTFFFYRAYVVAVPEGRKRNYAYLIFFFPTLLYWPSSLGKEAWMIFALGLATYGVARLLAPGERSGWGLFLTTLGLWLTGLVRPHVAGILAISLAAAYVVRRPPRRLAQLAPIVKVASIVVVMVVALLFVRAAEDFVLTPGGGLQQVVPTLEELSQRSSKGGSEFTPTVVRSPADLPIAALTVLFRPFPTEANNALALVTATVSGLLLLFCLARIRWLIAAIASARRQPFVICALVFVGLFIVAFSPFPNFGLLDRQRVQVLPYLFVLFTVPPRAVTSRAARTSAVSRRVHDAQPVA